MASERILELLNRPADPSEHRGDPRAVEGALDRRGQPRPAGADRDAHRGLRLHGRRHRRALGGPRGRHAVLHGASERLPRHPLRPRLHRDRARRVSARRRSSTATHQGRWLDNEPDRERLEWRNAIFFPWDPVAGEVQGRDGLHGPRVPPLADGPGRGPGTRIGARGSRPSVPRYVRLGAHGLARHRVDARPPWRRPAARRLRRGHPAATAALGCGARRPRARVPRRISTPTMRPACPGC